MLEFLLIHTMTIIDHLNLIFTKTYYHFGGIGIIAVLNQFCECNVRFADKPFAKFL